MSYQKSIHHQNEFDLYAKVLLDFVACPINFGGQSTQTSILFIYLYFLQRKKDISNAAQQEENVGPTIVAKVQRVLDHVVVIPHI